MALFLAGVLIFLSASLNDVVRSVAPGDEDVLCTREPHYAQSHPPNERLLLDSYSYQNLLHRVWQQLNIDGIGQGVSANIHTD